MNLDEAVSGMLDSIEEYAREVAREEIAHAAGDFSERPSLGEAQDALGGALRDFASEIAERAHQRP